MVPFCKKVWLSISCGNGMWLKITSHGFELVQAECRIIFSVLSSFEHLKSLVNLACENLHNLWATYLFNPLIFKNPSTQGSDLQTCELFSGCVNKNQILSLQSFTNFPACVILWFTHLFVFQTIWLVQKFVKICQNKICFSLLHSL